MKVITEKSNMVDFTKSNLNSIPMCLYYLRDELPGVVVERVNSIPSPSIEMSYHIPTTRLIRILHNGDMLIRDIRDRVKAAEFLRKFRRIRYDYAHKYLDNRENEWFRKDTIYEAMLYSFGDMTEIHKKITKYFWNEYMRLKMRATRESGDRMQKNIDNDII